MARQRHPVRYSKPERASAISNIERGVIDRTVTDRLSTDREVAGRTVPVPTGPDVEARRPAANRIDLHDEGRR